MRLIDLRNWAVRSLPIDEVGELEVDLQFEELISELAYFGITQVKELDELWKRNVSQVRKEQLYERSNFQDKILQAKITKLFKSPWCQNRIGIIRNLLSVSFKPYWELYSTRKNDIKRKEKIQQYFTSPLPLRPIPKDSLVRYRRYDDAIKFAENLKLQFTALRCFPDEVASHEFIKLNYTFDEVKDGIKTELIQSMQSKFMDSADLSRSPTDLTGIVIDVWRDKFKKNINGNVDWYNDQEIEKFSSLLADQAINKSRQGNSIYAGLIDRVRVCCLTEDFDCKIKWDTYAENGTGCAFLFSVPEVRKNIFWDAKKVEYVKKFDPLLNIKEWSNYHLGRHTYDLGEKFVSCLLNKHTDYVDDKEWRIFTVLPLNVDLSEERTWIPIPPSDLKAVICGPNLESSKFRSLVGVIRENYQHVSLFKCSQIITNSKYQIEPFDYN